MMRIIREKDLQVLWSWGETEREHLERTFQENLVQLLTTVRARQSGSRPFSREELQELAEEVQEAGELLEQGMLNCFALAGILYTLAGGPPAEQRKRQELLERFRLHIGRKVRVVRTSVAELRGRVLTLEAVHGFKGVLSDGEERWETPLDRLEIVGEEPSKDPAREPTGGEVEKQATTPRQPPAPQAAQKTPGAPTPPAPPEEPPVVLRRRESPAVPPAREGRAGFGTETVSRVMPPLPEQLHRAVEEAQAPPDGPPEMSEIKIKPKRKPLLRRASEEPAGDTTAVLRAKSRTEQARELHRKKVLKYTPRLRRKSSPGSRGDAVSEPGPPPDSD